MNTRHNHERGDFVTLTSDEIATRPIAPLAWLANLAKSSSR